jgi:SAM-dependent methyltransferase
MSFFWSELKWISSLNPKNQDLLENLRSNLEKYYRTNQNYYSDITGSEKLWMDQSYLPYQVILKNLKNGKKIFEAGCGNAAILSHNTNVVRNYYGMDFSNDLIKANQKRYPEASFIHIEDSNHFPFQDHTFDMVFSVFVLEHVVYPSRFLNEMVRVLNPGGKLFIFCPDYLGHLWMASQRLGLGSGTGMEKIREGRWLDGILTGIDSRLRIPIYAFFKKLLANKQPRFYINVNPICFSDPFQPDVDAVYVTHDKEIKDHTSAKIKWIENDVGMKKFCRKRRLIFLEGVKI